MFTSRPYREYTAARFARVVAAEDDAGALRLQLELGSRAVTADPVAFRDFVLAGPNPSEASEIWICRPENGRPPADYAEPSEDGDAWRRTIERLAPDDDYAAAVFLRVAAVRPADDDAAPPLEPPYRLRAERPYLVRVASYNPHLDTDELAATRLVPLYDELATAVVARAGGVVPADGTLDLLLSAIVGGPGWLELDVSLGVELVPAASLGWVADAVPGGARLPRDLAKVVAPDDPVAEAAVRAYAVVTESIPPDPGLRLRLLEHLRTIAPAEPRLVEAEGIALYGLGRDEEARRSLASIGLDELGAVGRATLLAAGLRQGRLPEPIERVRMADLARPEILRLVLDASDGLSADDRARLTEFVVGRMLSEERAAAWLREMSSRRRGGEDEP